MSTAPFISSVQGSKPSCLLPAGSGYQVAGLIHQPSSSVGNESELPATATENVVRGPVGSGAVVVGGALGSGGGCVVGVVGGKGKTTPRGPSHWFFSTNSSRWFQAGILRRRFSSLARSAGSVGRGGRRGAVGVVFLLKMTRTSCR